MTDTPTLRTPKIRFGHFPKFFEKGLANDKGDSYFEVEMLFSPEAQATPEYAAMKAAAGAAAKEKFGAELPDGFKSPFRKASAKKRQKDSTSYYPEDEFPGYILVSAKSKNKPTVVGAGIDPATGKLKVLETGDVQGGDFGRVSLHPFAYQVKGNSGVSFWMNNAQKMEDGPPLGGGARADDDFTPVGDAASSAEVDEMFS